MGLIDGKKLAEEIRLHCKLEAAKLKRRPGLAAILVGSNPASEVYVNMKHKACTEAGYYTEVHKIPKETSEKELLNLIELHNNKKEIDGILVQLPLPKHINEDVILSAVHPLKDVDGFNVINAGKLFIGLEDMVPATPAGIIRLLENYKVKIEGSNAVVIGRSRIVGRPIALMLLNRNATVTICHTKTKNLAEICKKADIIIAAAGSPKMITKEMIKDNAAIIDVGTTKVNDKLTGDCDFENITNALITPVPGGVGPMTIAMLLENTLKLSKRNQNE